MKRSFWRLLVAGVVYAFLIVLLRWEFSWQMLFFAAGVLLGLGFSFLDRLIQVFLIKPHEHLSEHVRQLVKERRFADAFRLLSDRGGEQIHLTVRSIFFMGAWVPVALYIITSTGNMLAVGLVMGIGLKMLYDVWVDWSDLDKIRQWLFWPIKRRMSDGEVKGVVVGYTVLFVGMSLGLV